MCAHNACVKSRPCIPKVTMHCIESYATACKNDQPSNCRMGSCLLCVPSVPFLRVPSPCVVSIMSAKSSPALKAPRQPEAPAAGGMSSNPFVDDLFQQGSGSCAELEQISIAAAASETAYEAQAEAQECHTTAKRGSSRAVVQVATLKPKQKKRKTWADSVSLEGPDHRLLALVSSVLYCHMRKMCYRTLYTVHSYLRDRLSVSHCLQRAQLLTTLSQWRYRFKLWKQQRL
jgi:hypothetical protein